MGRRIGIGVLALAAFTAWAAAEEKAAYPRPTLLVEPAELAKLKPDNLVILDARPVKSFTEGHVPGAVSVNAAEWGKAFAADQGTDAAAWAKRLGALGVTTDKVVVVYDDAMNKDAARVWWVLRYWGVKDARILNGGWKGHVAAGGKVEGGAPREVRALEVTLQPEQARHADKKFLLDRLKDAPFQIIDARSKEEHCGAAPGDNKKGGAIPGAAHLDWADLVDKGTHRFKSADELTKLFKDAGVDPAKPAVTHCQGGGRAAVMAFALELMGAKDVRNYYRGWSEWGNSDDTPVVKPKGKE